MYLGNIQFDQVYADLGYSLTEEDRLLWNEFHSQSADMAKSKKDSCFHVFYIPRCIIFKGEGAKNAIFKMFTPEKITNPLGEFRVYEQTIKNNGKLLI